MYLLAANEIKVAFPGVAALTSIKVDANNGKVIRSQGAATGSAIGIGYYKDFSTSFKNLKIIKTYQPNIKFLNEYNNTYVNWKKYLQI